jgi:Bacterial protein of unknown function (DUF899)
MSSQVGKVPPTGEMPRLSVFLRDGERLFHTYSTYTREFDSFRNTYNFLDHTPLGRQENGQPMAWLRSGWGPDRGVARVSDGRGLHPVSAPDAPQPGMSVSAFGYEWTVVDLDGPRIAQVKARRQESRSA